MSGRACSECGRGTVPSSTWLNADPITRAAWKAQGLVRYGARGLCPACYLRARQTGTLDAHLLEQHRFGKDRHRGICSRCGVDAPLADSLCVDCDYVTTDLHERQRWAS